LLREALLVIQETSCTQTAQSQTKNGRKEKFLEKEGWFLGYLTVLSIFVSLTK
jgi:hypothetical protein